MARKHTPDAHRWTVADSVTAARMAASLALLFLPVFSASFLTVYTFAGLTDALDGFLARKTGTVSAFGARLDSAADLLFFGVLLLRLFPLLRRTQPAGIWYVAGIVLLVRLISYAVAAVRFRRFDALHTRLNKPTGAAVFPLPYVLAVSGGIWYCRLVCFLALVASVQELTLQFRRFAKALYSASCFPGEPGDQILCRRFFNVNDTQRIPRVLCRPSSSFAGQRAEPLVFLRLCKVLWGELYALNDGIFLISNVFVQRFRIFEKNGAFSCFISVDHFGSAGDLVDTADRDPADR